MRAIRSADELVLGTVTFGNKPFPSETFTKLLIRAVVAVQGDKKTGEQQLPGGREVRNNQNPNSDYTPPNDLAQGG